MSTAIQYAKDHQERFVEELSALIRIPSVSTQTQYTDDVRKAANWIVEHLKQIGLPRAEVMETAGHPVVYAEWLGAGDNKPTVLVYGHYDVQPAAKADGWHTADPFEPVIENGNIVARGASDDKGQMFMHLKAFEALMQSTGTFPVNLKLLIEGEEEATSKNLLPFIKDNRDLLAADIALISDTAMHNADIPAIPYGLRGILISEVTVSGPERDLHSGMYGGAVENPLHVLGRLIASLHDENGRVQIPGFYDNVREIDGDERDDLQRIPYGEAELREETGVTQSWGEPEYSVYERMGARPVLDILMVRGGQVDGGIKAIIPESASAHLSCRLVPHQNPEQVFDQIQMHLKALAPPTVTVEMKKLSANEAVLIDRHDPAMQKAVAAYEKTVGKTPLFTLVGGSIPVVKDFKDLLGLPVIMMGFALPDDNIHAPNEKFALKQFALGIETLITYYELLAE
jgi:acetylornithine deacetylase/succinyl-diaminopimelate desuccinylase-like protein